MHHPPLSFGEEVTAVQTRLSGILLTEQTMETALNLITSLAHDTIAGSQGSGVTLLDPDGRPTTWASTDPLVDVLDRLQYGLGEGPCLTAWATSAVVRSGDLSAEARWPVWSSQAAGLGMRSVLSASLKAGHRSWGAMKVYAASADSFDATSEDVLRRFAAQAAIFVSNVHTSQAIGRLSAEFAETLRTRDTIAMARGMVMARRQLDAERAHRILMRLSHQARLPLSELARRMVASPDD